MPSRIEKTSPIYGGINIIILALINRGGLIINKLRKYKLMLFIGLLFVLYA